MPASSFGSARSSYGQSMLRDVMRALRIEDFSQNTPHHFGTFAEHVDAVIESPYLEEVDGKHGGLLTFAAAFHDIGKADVKDVHRRTGYDTFYGHEKRSAVLWNELADRALPGMSAEDKQYVSDLILAHHKSLHLAQSSDVKKFLAVIDGRPESFAADLIRLEMADVLAQSDYHRIEKLTEIQTFAEKLASVMPEGEGQNELRSVQSELAETIVEEEPRIQRQQLLDFTSNTPHWEARTAICKNGHSYDIYIPDDEYADFEKDPNRRNLIIALGRADSAEAVRAIDSPYHFIVDEGEWGDLMLEAQEKEEKAYKLGATFDHPEDHTIAPEEEPNGHLGSEKEDELDHDEDLEEGEDGPER